MIIIYCNIDNPTYDMHLFYTYLLPLGDFAKITLLGSLDKIHRHLNELKHNLSIHSATL